MASLNVWHLRQNGNLKLKDGNIISVNKPCMILSEADKYFVSFVDVNGDKLIVKKNNNEIRYIQQ